MIKHHPDGAQRANRLWWQAHPMTYDWRDSGLPEPGSREFFAEIDRRFITASPWYTGTPPFRRLIPYGRLAGLEVLEIGCGAGTHTALLAHAGSRVTAIDLTSRAVELTRQRLALNELIARVEVADAESLPFEDGSFDFVWSWGVIHHSARPGAILSEARRVLRPRGEMRCMVYHRHSLEALGKIIRHALFRGLLHPGSPEVALNLYSDGHFARHYSRGELHASLLDAGFCRATTIVIGQRAELIPLPGSIGPVKSVVANAIPERLVELTLGYAGNYLFATAEA